MKFIDLGSQRLRLRKFREDDAAVVFRWLSNPENVKYTRLDSSQRMEASQAFVAERIALAEADPCLDFEFIVERKETGAVIGFNAIHCQSEYEASLGFLFLPEYWGKGFAAECIRALIDFGFDKLGLHRIYAVCDGENHGSYRAMQKAGMRIEGRFIKARRGNNVLNREWRDEVVCAILREEWEKKAG